MAEHNRWQGTGSITNRDAGLTEVGMKQAELVGELLREEGILSDIDLAVIWH